MTDLTRITLSQGSLQDFNDCPRRFELRYLRRLAWPAIQAEPIQEFERLMARGERFHRLVQQALNNVPLDDLSLVARSDGDPHLEDWWNAWVKTFSSLLDKEKMVETYLGIPFEGMRLAGIFDLVLFDKDNVIIYDWKTTQKRPHHHWLENRMQSRVYPWLVTSARLQRHDLIPPDKLQMIYWFAAFPQQPHILQYSAEKQQEDENILRQTVQRIRNTPPDGFEPTSDIKTCRFCVYRSYCERGITAGSIADMEEEAETPAAVVLDLEQIPEIQF
ncbi:MAG TPA: PD-(D/E)XK nuclease family protein [Anaerolineaceae bacterium]